MVEGVSVRGRGGMVEERECERESVCVYEREVK